jgi:hypothetical protein
VFIGRSGAQHQTQKLAEESKLTVEKLADQMATGLQLQEVLGTDAKDAHVAQYTALSKIAIHVQSSAQAVAALPTQLNRIREQLQGY